MRILARNGTNTKLLKQRDFASNSDMMTKTNQSSIVLL